MKKLMRTGLIALSGLVAVAFSAQAMDKITIGTSADYPPWESINEDGDIVGFDRDFGDEVCKRASIECKWVNQAFDGLLPSLQVGKFDILITGMNITEERLKKVDFSVPYADAPQSVVTLKTSPLAKVTTREELEKELAGKTIGVQVGTTYESAVKANLPDTNLRVYDRPEQVIADLFAGRLDAGMAQRSAVLKFMEGDNGDKLAFAGPSLTGSDYKELGNGYGIAIRKDNADLKAKIDAAIAEMLADGTIAGQSQKWFGYDLSWQD